MTKWLSRFSLCVLASVHAGSALAQADFPYDSELLLDVAPMRGSKRIPNMDIGANGAIAFEMWCNRVEGQVVVAGETITVITSAPTDRQCPPERTRGDAELLASLNEVTSWRREGSTVYFVGPRTLRFKLPSN